MNDALEAQAKRLMEIAQELEKAAEHAKIAAEQFKQGEVPRGCAHSFAVDGHIAVATECLRDAAKDHRLKAKLD